MSGAKSDAADAHMLADMVRTDSHQLRPVAGDSAEAEAVKVVTRMHKTLIWERTRTAQRLRHALREYFPAALEAFEDLDAADTLELLAKAPDPAAAARLTTVRSARRSSVLAAAASATKPRAIQAALRTEHLGQPAVVTAAYAASVRALVAVLGVLDEQVKSLQGQVEAHFGRHPAAEIVLSANPASDRSSAPGCSQSSATTPTATPAPRPARTTPAPARSPSASGKKKVALARYVHNDRLIDALMGQAFAALNASPGARAYYDQQRARGAEHNAALRQLANRLVGILHGCLKTSTLYDEPTAWQQHPTSLAA